MNALVGLGIAALLIVANGLFVAAEFALVSVRRPLVEQRAEAGDRRSRSVLRELQNLSFTLASAQFGITATSLILGYVAEQALGETMIRPMLEWFGLPSESSLSVAIIVALLLSTIVQMVVGELFPKNLAISRPLGVALAVTPITRAFGIVFGPLIRVFDRAAGVMTRKVFRVEIASELEGGHSLDELARIVTASGEQGSLTDQQAQLLQRALGLGDRRVSEVMVPRPDIAWLEAESQLQQLREAARSTGHSRFPVRGRTEDEVLGTVHVKDLLTIPAHQHGATSVTQIAEAPLIVPESESLRRLLGELRRAQRTFAVVIDEYGSTAGIITVEDVLEQLVGDISDEFDRRHHVEVRRLGARRHLVPGTLRVGRFEELFGVSLPEGEYESVAGFVLDSLGHIPEPGERVVHTTVELTVRALDGVRITEVVVRELADDAETGDPETDDPQADDPKAAGR